VWHAWADAGELSSWLAPQARASPRVGGAYELFWEPGHPERNSTLGCRVTRVAQGRELAFQWRGPVQFADLMNREPLPTSVTVRLDPAGDGGTLMTLEHAGWGAGARWAEARAWQRRAWEVAFARLVSRLEVADDPVSSS
jgi:uncharacterized protein YndB with AHSA1/START domain